MKNKSNKLYVFLTIDTEASMHKRQPLSPDLMIYGKIGGQQYGIPWIMKGCNRFGCKATFFVSALEAVHYGEAMVKEVCDTITAAGHDVQLHIHSGWRNKTKFLWENSFEDQLALIKEGADILKRITGNHPIAHRAGGLGADMNTLKALAQTKISIDSSMYHRGPYCRLWQDFPTVNALNRAEEVIEVPITQFDQLGLGRWKSYRTFDINADILPELKSVIQQAKQQNLRTINLLMHSFSFVHRSPDRSSITPNFMDMKRFENLLSYLSEDPEIEIITFKAFYDRYQNKLLEINGADYLPRTGIGYTLLRSARHFNRSWKNRITVFGAIATIFVLMAIIIVLLL